MAGLLIEFKFNLPSLKNQLRKEIIEDEFLWAQRFFDEANGDETMVRISGFLTRVALERLLLDLVQKHNLQADLDARTRGKHANIEHILVTLKTGNIVRESENKELQALYSVGNECAHAKHSIDVLQVGKLVRDASRFTGKL